MRHFGSKTYRIDIDLKPALDEKTLDKRLLADFDKYKNSDFINALGELLPRKLIPVVIETCGIDPRVFQVNSVTKAERQRLVHLLKAFPVEISGARPIAGAIITTGGVSVKQINPKTMESKLVKGLVLPGSFTMLTPIQADSTCKLLGQRAELAGQNAAEEETM